MNRLFETAALKGIMLANRFVRSATWEGLATEEGSVTPALVDVSRKLANGGVGLIIAGHAYVSREGQVCPWQLGIYADSLIPGLTEMTNAVHEAGAKICAQLAHAGVFADNRLTRLPARGPSAGWPDGPWGVSREMTVDHIKEAAGAFAAAAVRARESGFDAVQLHGAHSYLISQFLSPFFNKRNDDYGGSIGNRNRFAVETVHRIRKAVGDDFPVLIKLNSEDFIQDGLTLDDMLEATAGLQAAGVDAIEMSGGTVLSGNKIPSRPGRPAPGEPEAYYEKAAQRFKQVIGIPLILVGGIHTIETAERLVREDIADYISLCRPLICEPGLVNRWKSGHRAPAKCRYDNGCFRPGFKAQGVHCVVEERGA
jgi:2,4-dienoyl-CoA reductase-like NADH-dependent reductase (Old Yellow Enzyme family)